MDEFSGFSEKTIQFFLDLRFHNDTAWFHSHRQEYESAVRAPFYAFINAMAPIMKTISDDIELRPNRCLARINRDIRFTRDKSPYRDHLWLLFRRSGEARDQSVMYWFELSPESTQWGLGFWGANRPAMDVLRTWMETKPSKVLGAFEEAQVPDARLKLFGDKYVKKVPPPKVPKALAPLYPMKELYIQPLDCSLKDAYSAKLVKKVSEDYLRLKPLYSLFREAADIGAAGLDL